MLSKSLEKTLNDLYTDANEKAHEYITIEHLLLSLLEESSAKKVLSACGADFEKLKVDLVDFIETTTPIIKIDREDKETQPTLGFHRVLQRAAFHVQSCESELITGANVLVAIFSDKESQAVYFLRSQQITRLDLLNYMAHGISKSSPFDDSVEFDDSSIEDSEHKDDISHDSALQKYTINLNEQARSGKIDNLIGRQEETQRVLQILCRRRKNNPILVGEAGVGKTAIAEGLAKKIIDGDIPDTLKDSIVYSLDMGAVLAGTKYRGDFEKRFDRILKELMNDPNAILFIDEIHTIIGAGSTAGGSMDASNILKPLLSSGNIKCIGSTTYHEFRNIFSKDHALSRRFQKVDVLEPSIDETYKILKGLKPNLEAHHNIHYTDKALKTAAKLADRYMNDRFLPDKAIDIVDEAGASQALMSRHQRKKTIRVSDIEKVIAQVARIPQSTINKDDKKLLEHLESKLKLKVFGQDSAVEAISTAVKLSRAGLRSQDKNVGSFLFAGPTGVGKTELTKQLANTLGLELLRFDMSEYMEAHTVSRLIGAPPGYVGFDQGGLLTDAVTKNPHSIVLLDEIEKGHPDIFNLLLQVMDNGKLTDNNGRVADFSHVVLIMTTNAGAHSLSSRAMGFNERNIKSDSTEAITRTFSPEFRNRLDAIIQFDQLTKEVVGSVLNKFLNELSNMLQEKSVVLRISKQAKAWIIEEGFDELMGARPMSRVIQENIKKPLAEMILFGDLSKQGGIVNITLKNNKLILSQLKQVEENTA
jgi:ATP-dependent Clp protease ATP-binding subunit ClpA